MKAYQKKFQSHLSCWVFFAVGVYYSEKLIWFIPSVNLVNIESKVTLYCKKWEERYIELDILIIFFRDASMTVMNCANSLSVNLNFKITAACEIGGWVLLLWKYSRGKKKNPQKLQNFFHLC